ncbi:hypothetical protein Scep_001977 [Stephania cephalantha]|uniref:Uncharacterized protein n=1 Tax=Stephania cephalantha TaxID=152367 RepID=A0AAP0L9G0_9MAGN
MQSMEKYQMERQRQSMAGECMSASTMMDLTIGDLEKEAVELVPVVDPAEPHHQAKPLPNHHLHRHATYRGSYN